MRLWPYNSLLACFLHSSSVFDKKEISSYKKISSCFIKKYAVGHIWSFLLKFTNSKRQQKYQAFYYEIYRFICCASANLQECYQENVFEFLTLWSVNEHSFWMLLNTLDFHLFLWTSFGFRLLQDFIYFKRDIYRDDRRKLC